MPEEFDAFMELYSDLPREGPGNMDSLLNVLDIADTPVMGRIFDAACGSGADSAIIERALPGAKIIGVDKQPQFIKAAKARGLHAEFLVGDMLQPDGIFDLIWCAGAVYFFGIEAALDAWKQHLSLEGKIAFSELVWLKEPSAPAKTFWDDAFPAMTTQNGLIQRIETSGFKVLSATPLGRSGWDPYLDALRERINLLQSRGPAMDSVLAETSTEIALYDSHFGEYDYVVFLIEPA